MKTFYKVQDGELDLISRLGDAPEGYTEVEVINKIPQLPDDVKPLYEKRLQNITGEGEKRLARKELSETDWVEPYIIRHELGLETLPEGSEKLVIHAKRQELKALVSS